MEVVAFLPPPLLSHLRVVLSRGHSLTAVPSWDSLDDVVRHRVVDAAVIDVQVEGNGTLAGVRGFLSRHPALPLVVYTTLSPNTLQGIVELAKHGVEHVVLHRFDDDPRRFLELLERLPGYALGDELLGLLARPLSQVTPEVAQAVERLFRTPTRFNDTPDLAAASGTTVRTLYRQLAAAGFASPRMLVRSARLLRAYSYLQEPGFQFKDVARKLGYPDPRTLSRQLQATVGLRPSDLRGQIAPGEFVGLLAARLLDATAEVADG